MLIVGPSGSGKSTLALQLALAGWPYLSDDELLLSWSMVKLRRAVFAVFLRFEAAKRFKNCFEPEVVFGSQRRSKRSPGSLLFIRLEW